MYYLAQADLRVDGVVALLGWIIQGGPTAMALIALYFLARHHKATLREHKKELDARDLEFKTREDTCREELASCQLAVHEIEKEFRSKTEELLENQIAHEAELLTQIRNALKTGG